jgi:hypothetical protein
MTTQKTTTLLLIASVFIIGCGEKPKIKNGTIISKSYFTQMSNDMPKGICRYAYWYGEALEFNDSCNKYFIGDTITFKK